MESDCSEVIQPMHRSVLTVHQAQSGPTMTYKELRNAPNTISNDFLMTDLNIQTSMNYKKITLLFIY